MSDASISSGTFSGSGAMADRISAGGPPRNTVAGSALPARLGDRVVVAAALADLPVHAGACARRAPASGTCRGCGRGRSGCVRVDERQRDERPAVLGPGGDRRQPVEPDVGGDALGDRAAATPRVMPTLSSSRPTSRAPHSLPGVGGRSVSASSTSRLISRSGRSPNASSARRAVPNRLVTSRKSAPVTLVKSSAGPPAAITRRWISAASRCGSTGASTVTMSSSRRSWSMNARRSGNDTGRRLAAHRLVGAAAVDGRHLRAHRAQVRRELAAVMDAVVVGEADELHAPAS